MTRLELFTAAAIAGLCAGSGQIRLGGKYGFDQRAVKIAAATNDALNRLEYRESAPGKIALKALREIASDQAVSAIITAKHALEELEAAEAAS